MSIRLLFAAVLSAGCFTASVAPAAEDPQGVEFFEKKIRPVLVERCYKCHSASAKEVQGELLLDTRDGIRKGGEQGHAVVPGSVAESLIVSALRHTDELKMPPNEKLPASVVADFETWIKMGAPDPREGKAAVAKREIDFDQARRFWAFQPPKAVAAPKIEGASWARTDIDRFVEAQWKQHKLKPVGEADKRTLIRRATFDLVGLPPTPEQVEAFVNDSSPEAFAKVVDRLLDSPQFGERWGRHWLDVARYGESSGKERDVPYLYAWRYRDYVIDAFNADKPFDQFVREQVAGDLLPAENDAQRNEHIVATGFLALGTKSLNEKNAEQFLMDEVDEQLDVTCRAVLALTVGCARCHDHKFDPIPTTDYYALAGIFKSTQTLSGIVRGARDASGNNFVMLARADAPPVTLTAEQEKEVEEIQAEIIKLKAAPAAPATEEAPKTAKNAKQAAKLAKLAKQQAKKKGQAEPAVDPKIAELEARLSKLRPAPAAGEPAMAVKEASRPVNCRVNIRGEIKDLGPEVPRGFATVLTNEKTPQIDKSASGRRELAEWLASRDNPLTARVMANRVWHHLFGAGLVATVDNFGELGERPSHPELLDYLAVRFMDRGWSVKKLVREIVLSRTYQLSSDHDAGNFAVDAENRYLWRMSRRRLDAESIRDAVLSASGRLDLARPVGSLVTKIGTGEVGRANTGALRGAFNHRSVYLPILRGVVPDILNVFDVADPSLVVGQREVTTVATQALFMMNSPFIVEESQHAAQRVLAQGDLDDSARVDAAYRLLLGRPAAALERERTAKFLQDFAASLDNKRSDEQRRLDAWTSVCQAIFASAEFRYVY